MRFVVIFSSYVGEYAINFYNRETTLRDLLYVREKLGVKLPEERIAPEVKGYHSNVVFNVTSDEILKDEALKRVFYDNQKVRVLIPRGALNKYVIVRIEEVKKDEKTGEILHVYLHYTLIEDGERKIFEDWVAAGCPLSWNPDAEDEEENNKEDNETEDNDEDEDEEDDEDEEEEEDEDDEEEDDEEDEDEDDEDEDEDDEEDEDEDDEEDDEDEDEDDEEE